GYTFIDAQHDPEIHLRVALLHNLHARTTLSRFTDGPTELPEVWEVSYNDYNISEAAYFGCPVMEEPDQVPDTQPIFADDAQREAMFDIDIERPLDNPHLKSRLAFLAQMEKIAQGMTFEGRPVRVMPWALVGTDGPVTVACNLRGT